MKSIYLTVIVLFVLSLGSYSQEITALKNNETKSPKAIRGFFSFDRNFTSLNGNNVALYGGSFGIVINDRTRIGLGGYSPGTKNRFQYLNPSENNKAYQLDNEFGYFGLTLEYLFFPDAPVHISIPLLLAGGSVVIKQEVPLNQLTFPDSEGIERSYWATVEKRNLSVVEPGINAEVEILSWMNLDLGSSYRFVLCSDLNSISNTARNLSGISFHVGLKFTCF